MLEVSCSMQEATCRMPPAPGKRAPRSRRQKHTVWAAVAPPQVECSTKQPLNTHALIVRSSLAAACIALRTMHHPPSLMLRLQQPLHPAMHASCRPPPPPPPLHQRPLLQPRAADARHGAAALPPLPPTRAAAACLLAPLPVQVPQRPAAARRPSQHAPRLRPCRRRPCCVPPAAAAASWPSLPESSRP